MNISQIDELARLGESRTYEFKESISWKNNHVKLKVTKSIMAMSNVRDGGMILGIKERADTFDPVGMSESDANTFRHDDMADHVGKYAHPSIDFSINRVTDKERVLRYLSSLKRLSSARKITISTTRLSSEGVTFSREPVQENTNPQEL